MNKKAIALSFLGGFLSLSIEVIYIRILGFSLHSIPQAFSLTLAAFLLGIACGSLIGKNLCRQGKASVSLIGRLFLLAGIFDLIALMSLIHFSAYLVLLVFCVLGTAMLRGIVFPVVHHLGAEKQKTGAAISNVYFANVLGCTLSPLLVGFYLFDVLNTQQTYLLIIFLTFVVAFLSLLKQPLQWLAMLLAGVSLWGMSYPEKLIHRLAQQDDMTLDTLIENKHGFIQVYTDHKTQDKVVLGNNVYDGKLNVNLNHNVNGIDRAYLLPVIAPHSENILVIGLSTGSWVEVLSASPMIKKITVIELNPAYTKFAAFYPEMARLLKDPRIEIVADDGRRWLARHSQQKFDYILMNTTWYWRNYSTNLLSQEFLRLVKQHLMPQGFVAYNTTGLYDSYFTAKSVFPDVYQYKNFAIASLVPIAPLSREKVEQTFAKMYWPYNNQPVFATPTQLKNGVEQLFQAPVLPYEQIKFPRSPEMITDKNMIPEYKYGILNKK